MQIKRLLKALRNALLKIVVSNRWYGLVAILFFFAIKELSVNGKTNSLSLRKRDNKISLLAFSPRGFRKDINCIVSSKEFRMLVIEDYWMARITSLFYTKGQPKYNFNFNPDDLAFKYKTEQKELRNFLYHFLSKLYRLVRIDCVISPHPRYVSDMEWGAVSTKMGIPHILISRDSQFASSPYLLNKMKGLFRDGLPKFEGKHIIVQSELDKEVYIDSGYVSPDRISSLGCPRMDDFIRKSKGKRLDAKERRKKVVFLPFTYKEKGTFDLLDLRSYVEELQLFFIRFATKFPEIDVVIKPKLKGLKLWEKEVMFKMIGDTRIENSKILNLIIRDDVDIHSLFLESDVVCGLQTSALIEAAVIGLPVIIPYFKDVQNQKYDERLFYRDAFDLFDIAKDVNELESLILKRLHNQTIDKKIMEGRKALFESLISSLDGDATEKYVTLIKEIVNKQNMHVLAKR